jgi:hypothetical protein
MHPSPCPVSPPRAAAGRNPSCRRSGTLSIHLLATATPGLPPWWQRAPLPKGSGGFLWPVALSGDGRAGAGATAPGIMAAAAAGLSGAVSGGRRWRWDLQRRKGIREVRMPGRGPI